MFRRRSIEITLFIALPVILWGWFNELIAGRNSSVLTALTVTVSAYLGYLFFRKLIKALISERTIKSRIIIPLLGKLVMLLAFVITLSTVGFLFIAAPMLIKAFIIAPFSFAITKVSLVLAMISFGVSFSGLCKRLAHIFDRVSYAA